MGFVVLGRQSCEPGSSNIDHKVRQGTNPLLAVVTAWWLSITVPSLTNTQKWKHCLLSALLQPIHGVQYTDWSLLVYSREEEGGWPRSWTTPESSLSASVAKMKNRKMSELNTKKEAKPPNPLFQFLLHLESITFPHLKLQWNRTMRQILLPTYPQWSYVMPF